MGTTNETINDRIQKLIDMQGHNINSFSVALGYENNGTIYDIVKGKVKKETGLRKKNTPKEPIILKICKTFGVRYEWLMSGIGAVYETGRTLTQLENVGVNEVKLIELPYIDFYAMASFNTSSGNGIERSQIKTKTIIQKENLPYYDDTCIVKFMGNSMEPTINADSVLLARKVKQEDWKYIGNAVYAVIFAGRFEIKRIIDNDFEQGYLWLVADNPKNGKLKIEIQDITQILKIEEVVSAKIY